MKKIVCCLLCVSLLMNPLYVMASEPCMEETTECIDVTAVSVDEAIPESVTSEEIEMSATEAEADNTEAEEIELSEETDSVSVELDSQTAQDTTAPSLISVKLSESTAMTSSTVEIVLVGKDSGSGLDCANGTFLNEETGKEISFSVYASYWDSDSNKYRTYPNGEMHGEIELDEYLPSGIYKLDSISIYDKADNGSYYDAEEWPSIFNGVSLTLTNNATADLTAPVVHNIVLEKTTIEPSEKTKITASVSDDISGVRYITIRFKNAENGKEICADFEPLDWDDENNCHIAYREGEYVTELELDPYLPSGEYRLDYVFLGDVAGNDYSYHADREDDTLATELKNLTIHIINNAAADIEGPQLNDIRITQTTVSVGRTLNVTVDASDDLSGVYDGYLYFFNEELEEEIEVSLETSYWDSETWEIIPYEDGLLHGEEELDEELSCGVYVISGVSLYDKSGNATNYGYAEDELPIPESLKELAITVVNDNQKLTLSSIENVYGGVKLTWIPDSSVYKYVVYYREIDGNKWRKAVATKELTYTKKGLKSGTTYEFYVAGLNKKGKLLTGYQTRSVYFTYYGAPKVTSAVASQDGIQVSWQSVPGIDYYQVYMKEYGADTWEEISDVESSSEEIWEVEHGKQYSFTVACLNDDGEVISAYDPKGMSAYYFDPTYIRYVYDEGAKAMEVAWEEDLRATGYQIQYSPYETFKKSNKIVSIRSNNISQIVIKKLTPGKEYYVRVRTYSKIGKKTYYSAWSDAEDVIIS